MAVELERGVIVPACLRCTATTVKPDVVMFGESVAPEVVEAQMRAVERCRGVLVLGSSLKVMSGYRFVLAALKQQKPVALVGLGAMRGEERVDLVVREPLGPTLTAVCDALGLDLATS